MNYVKPRVYEGRIAFPTLTFTFIIFFKESYGVKTPTQPINVNCFHVYFLTTINFIKLVTGIYVCHNVNIIEAFDDIVKIFQ